ncbi:uncharacterized protein ARMOST_17909 [Armillaria ostoyae]|uniref:Uncharacterized protein n=1 Tax=Armillaria ostoyae TaxID=47428 RepID=A0A284S0A5_ARMOS|nr:uncharacterized protein ARMOST_17909 [Armillaria ostoyae]
MLVGTCTQGRGPIIFLSSVLADKAPTRFKFMRSRLRIDGHTVDFSFLNTSSNVAVELFARFHAGDADSRKDFSFVSGRAQSPAERQSCGSFVEPTYKVVIKCEYALRACKDVYPGVSWNAASLVGAYDFARLVNSQLQLKHEVFIAFLDEFTAYRISLALKADQLKSQSDIYVLCSLNLLISTIEDDWKGTIHTILTWTPAAFISRRRFIQVRMSWSTTSSYVSQVLARVS